MVGDENMLDVVGVAEHVNVALRDWRWHAESIAVFETIHPAAILRQGWSEKHNSGQGKLDRCRMGLKFEEVNRYITNLKS